MSFSFHTDVADYAVFGTLSTPAFGLWVLAGTWTSAHRSPGFVPDHAVDELAGNLETVQEIVDAGAWTRAESGYHMEYGTNSDFPMPVWRYDEGSPANGLIDVLPDTEL